MIILVAVLIAVPAFLLMLSGGTALKIDPPVTAIGNMTPIQVHIENSHGVRRITGVIEQGGSRYTVFDVQETPHRVMFWRRHEAPQVKTFQVGKQQAPALHDGKARLIIEAQSNDLRGRGGFHRERRRDHHAAAAHFSRRRPALHQPGRFGTGCVHCLRGT